MGRRSKDTEGALDVLAQRLEKLGAEDIAKRYVLDTTNEAITKFGRKAAIGVGKELIFLDRLKDVLKAVPVEPPPNNGKAKVGRPVKLDRVLNLLLSDIHFGSDLDPRESMYRYGIVEEARRLAKIAERVVDFKPEHRDNTDLHIYIIGDIIEGKLHSAMAAAAQAEQIARALHNLRLSLRHMIVAGKFRRVKVWILSGNHDRDKSRHPERAIDGKWDSHATTIGNALKTYFIDWPNVEFEIALKPFISVNIFGWRMYASHGDGSFSVGNPGSNLNIRKANELANKWNLIVPDKAYDVYAIGHVHVATNTALDSGATLFTNGCVVPPGPYALSIDSVKPSCSQWMFESTPEVAVGHMEKIYLNASVDENEELDKIVSPWPGFNGR